MYILNENEYRFGTLKKEKEIECHKVPLHLVIVSELCLSFFHCGFFLYIFQFLNRKYFFSKKSISFQTKYVRDIGNVLTIFFHSFYREIETDIFRKPTEFRAIGNFRNINLNRKSYLEPGLFILDQIIN